MFRTSIKTAMMVPISCLGILLLAVVGLRAFEHWNAYQRGLAIQQFDTGANRFVGGIFEVLMERLATNNGLQAPEPASPAVLSEIESRRVAVHEKFDSGLAAVSLQNFSQREKLLADLKAALAKADSYRRQANDALRLPRDQRDETLRKTFVPVMTDSVNAALKVWFAALHHAASGDPVLARLAMIKEIGWQMRDISGKERSNLSQSISAEAPISPDLQTLNAGMRSRVETLWEQLGNLTLDERTHPAIRKAMAGAQRDYFGGFRGLADQLKLASDNGAKYPMTTQQWVETSTPLIGSLLNVMYAAGDASEAHVEGLIADAWLDLALSVAILLVGYAAAVGCLWLVRNRVVRPLNELSIAVRKLADGDLGVEVPGADKEDEIGSVAKAVQVFKDHAGERQRLQARMTNEDAGQRQRQSRIGAMITEFDQDVQGLLSAFAGRMDQMQDTSKQLFGIAERAAGQSLQVVRTAEQASTRASSVASAAEQLSSSTADIEHRADQAMGVVRRATDAARLTNQRVQALRKAASQIDAIIALIRNIAQQTNLLALNATIEAARAGEAGRGFSVVAQEVKQLADQTAKATDEIAKEISSIQSETGAAADAIQAIVHTIEEVDAFTAAITAAVVQQGAATNEITQNISGIAMGTKQISTDIAELSSASEATSRSASETQDASVGARQQTAQLRSTIEKFLREVAAA